MRSHEVLKIGKGFFPWVTSRILRSWMVCVTGRSETCMSEILKLAKRMAR